MQIKFPIKASTADIPALGQQLRHGQHWRKLDGLVICMYQGFQCLFRVLSRQSISSHLPVRVRQNTEQDRQEKKCPKTPNSTYTPRTVSSCYTFSKYEQNVKTASQSNLGIWKKCDYTVPYQADQGQNSQMLRSF